MENQKQERIADNKHTDILENSANGLDSETVVGGQNGRNSRGIGSSDMDSQNGVLRMGDQDSSTMEVTQKGLDSAVADESKSDTSSVAVTTSGPDDYASANLVGVPNAQRAAKEHTDEEPAESPDETGNDDPDANEPTQKDEEAEIAKTGTSIDHKPTY
jgi:hypothetical protein